jgi:hypothetical protein
MESMDASPGKPTNERLTLSDVSVREHARLRKLIRDIGVGLALLGAEHQLVRQVAALLQPPAEEEAVPLEPWGQLGRLWWFRAGEALGASKQQVRMAAGLSLGLSSAAAARLAGYGDPSGNGRKSGYVAARSVKVGQLRELAERELEARRGL